MAFLLIELHFKTGWKKVAWHYEIDLYSPIYFIYIKKKFLFWAGKEIVKFWRFFVPFFHIAIIFFFWYQTLSKVVIAVRYWKLRPNVSSFRHYIPIVCISKIWFIFWFPFIPKNISFFLELPKQNSLTSVMYGTGIEPVCPREFLAVHHCSSSFEIIVNISPFLKGKSSGSLQKKNAF